LAAVAAITETPSRLLVMNQKHFAELLDRNPRSGRQS
jgi:hypothetical protein